MERMKYIRLLWLLLPFLWQSCAEDKGNYDYKDLKRFEYFVSMMLILPFPVNLSS